jgi:hypothetical protein
VLPCAPIIDSLETLQQVEACPTAALLALAHHAHELGLTWCLEPGLRDMGLGFELPTNPPPPPLPNKDTRDAYDTPNSYESENFVLRWGYGISDQTALATLEVFEATWDVLVDSSDYPAPWGSDSTKFNVYVGDTGGGTPTSYGYAGYYWTDPDGWPMVVLGENARVEAGSSIADVIGWRDSSIEGTVHRAIIWCEGEVIL